MEGPSFEICGSRNLISVLEFRLVVFLEGGFSIFLRHVTPIYGT